MNTTQISITSMYVFIAEAHFEEKNTKEGHLLRASIYVRSAGSKVHLT
jgi:hypothetical protein